MTVTRLSARLQDQASVLRERFGRDVTEPAGGGAAGGLGGALWAAGAELVSGVDLVARHVGLEAALDGADLVITGEGSFDDTSLQGKVTGDVLERAERAGVPSVLVAGSLRRPWPGAVDLVARFGEHAARTDTARCLRTVAAELTGTRGS